MPALPNRSKAGLLGNNCFVESLRDSFPAAQSSVDIGHHPFGDISAVFASDAITVGHAATERIEEESLCID